MLVAQIIPANVQLEKAGEQVVDIPAPQIAEEIYKVGADIYMFNVLTTL